MKKNDVVKVEVKRQVITPATSSNYHTYDEIPTQNVTLDVMIDSVGASTAKGHYLNENDARYYVRGKYTSVVVENLVVRVEIDNDGSVWEYTISANHKNEYELYQILKKEAKKLHIHGNSREWCDFMKNNGVNVFMVTEDFSNKANGVLVD